MLTLFACSAPKWKVRDAQGHVMVLQDVRFEPNPRVILQIGDVRREILASQIEWLQIDPSQMKVEEGIVYYGVKARLLDGSLLPDSVLGENAGGVFIPVDAELVATTRANEMRVRIAQIRELGSLEYFTRMDSMRHAELIPKRTSTVLTDSSKANNSAIASSGGGASSILNTSSSSSATSAKP
jgi:hypothetical protein